MSERKYFDIEGGEVSLYQLVRKEPDWAESRIKEGEKAIAENERLRAEVEQLRGGGEPFGRVEVSNNGHTMQLFYADQSLPDGTHNVYTHPEPAAPLEATPAMEQAAEEYWNNRKFSAFSSDPRTWAGVYKAMVTAAPRPEDKK
jgi:hypothetical protein